MILHTLKILSGGQTGVDRAALDHALKYRITCGGWCPKGRLAEDGSIPLKYPLVETPTDKYPERTEWTIEHSDGTLIFTIRECFDQGTLLTRQICRQYKKPCLVIDLDHPHQSQYEKIKSWVNESDIHTLNIAGPRESAIPGIYEKTMLFLEKMEVY